MKKMKKMKSPPIMQTGIVISSNKLAILEETKSKHMESGFVE